MSVIGGQKYDTEVTNQVSKKIFFSQDWQGFQAIEQVLPIPA